MATDEMKTVANALIELSESYTDFLHSIKGTVREVKTAKKLWKNADRPWLIKLGLALIVFPEPAVSDILGSILIAVGTVQEGMRRRALHVEDIPRTFQNIFKELQSVEESFNGH